MLGNCRPYGKGRSLRQSVASPPWRRGAGSGGGDRSALQQRAEAASTKSEGEALSAHAIICGSGTAGTAAKGANSSTASLHTNPVRAAGVSNPATRKAERFFRLYRSNL